MKTKVKLSWNFYDPSLREFSIGIEMDCSEFPRIGKPQTPLAIVQDAFLRQQAVIRFSQTHPVPYLDHLLTTSWKRDGLTGFTIIENDMVHLARLHAFDAGFDVRGQDYEYEYEPFNGLSPMWVHTCLGRDRHFINESYSTMILLDNDRVVAKFNTAPLKSCRALIEAENYLVAHAAREFIHEQPDDPEPYGSDSDSE